MENYNMIFKEWVPIVFGGQSFAPWQKKKKELFVRIFLTIFIIKIFKLATSRPTHYLGHHL
jgi:hypothetical protein